MRPITEFSTEPRQVRTLWQPRPGFYLLRLRRGTPLIPALIFQACPMVIPEPGMAGGPNPADWCRLDHGPPRYGALIDGSPADVERVSASRSLRPITAAEYSFRMGPLRQWAQTHPQMPEAHPDRPVDLAVLTSLF
jgi:hypothetical protein